MSIRRVVTGHDDNGRSVFASDEKVPGLAFDALSGWQFFDMWGADKTPTFPDGGQKPHAPAYFPSAAGFRFSFSVIPPESTPPVEGLNEEAALAEVNAALPGMMGNLEPDGMHTTDTVDMEVILSGEVTLILADGQEKSLGPGDTVVQNGTRHVWRVRGDKPCLMAVFMVGANRAGEDG